MQTTHVDSKNRGAATRRLSLLAALAGLIACTAAHAESWREMSTGRFHLYSTSRDSVTLEIASQLQAFDHFFAKIQVQDGSLPDVPTLVYVLGHGAFQRYGATQSNAAGEFYGRAFFNLITIDADQPFESVKQAVFHEYIHYLLRNTSTGRIPAWLDEGYAEMYSAFRVKGREVSLGGAPVNVLFGTRDWIPLARILEVKQSDPDYRSERLATQFYAESWALVHWLFMDDTTHAQAARTYLQYLDEDVPEPDAFRKAFPFDKQAMDKALHDFVYGRKIHVLKITLADDPFPAKAPVTAMTRAQADAALMRLSFYIGRMQQAKELTAKALAEEPQDLPVRALAARIQARDEHPADVSDLVTQLGHGGTTEPQARVDLAYALVGRRHTPEQVRQALALLDDLAHTDAPSLEAVNLWARTAEASGMPPAARIPVLQKASARADHNTELLADLANAERESGNKAAARAIYDHIILVSWSPQERLWAQKLADSPALADTESADEAASD